MRRQDRLRGEAERWKERKGEILRQPRTQVEKREAVPSQAGNRCDKSWMAGQRKGRWEECIISHLLPPSLWGPYFPGRLPQRPDAPRRNPAQSGSAQAGPPPVALPLSRLLRQHLEPGFQRRTVVVERSVEGMAERSAAALGHTPFLSSLSNGGLGVRSFTARSSLSLMVLQFFPSDKWLRHDDKLH